MENYILIISILSLLVAIGALMRASASYKKSSSYKKYALETKKSEIAIMIDSAGEKEFSNPDWVRGILEQIYLLENELGAEFKFENSSMPYVLALSREIQVKFSEIYIEYLFFSHSVDKKVMVRGNTMTVREFYKKSLMCQFIPHVNRANDIDYLGKDRGWRDFIENHDQELVANIYEGVVKQFFKNSSREEQFKIEIIKFFLNCCLASPLKEKVETKVVAMRLKV